MWQQVQYAGDDLLHLSRNFRPLGRELGVTFPGELGHTAKIQSPRRHSKLSTRRAELHSNYLAGGVTGRQSTTPSLL